MDHCLLHEIEMKFLMYTQVLYKITGLGNRNNYEMYDKLFHLVTYTN